MIKNKKLMLFSMIFIFFLVGGMRYFFRIQKIIQASPINSWREEVSADCGVVLTGGAGRVREGMDLLYRRSIRKLIVAGVFSESELADIFPQLPYYQGIQESDIILEKRSRTTYGNAVQTLTLIEALQCRELVLITSQYHMYRAYKTFHQVYPHDFEIIMHAVPPVQFSIFDLNLETLKTIFYSFWAF